VTTLLRGNGVQIFSMMVTFGGIFQPIKAILASGLTFERFADAHTDMTGPRLVFCAIQVLGLAMVGAAQLSNPAADP
jgi:hypothetical protein